MFPAIIVSGKATEKIINSFEKSVAHYTDTRRISYALKHLDPVHDYMNMYNDIDRMITMTEVLLNLVRNDNAPSYQVMGWVQPGIEDENLNWTFNDLRAYMLPIVYMKDNIYIPLNYSMAVDILKSSLQTTGDRRAPPTIEDLNIRFQDVLNNYYAESRLNQTPITWAPLIEYPVRPDLTSRRLREGAMRFGHPPHQNEPEPQEQLVIN
jgi:hypothetical protein